MPRGKPERYNAIAEALGSYMETNKLRVGDKLPPERKLAEMFSCSPMTIRKALRKLEQKHLIRKVPSVGSFAGCEPLREDRDSLVGIIFPDDDLYYYRLLTRLEGVFERFRFHPIVKLTNHAAVKEDEILEFFGRMNVKAVIAVPNELCIHQYEKLRCPVIFFDHYSGKSTVPHVISDDFSGSVSAMEYLLSLGHRKIAYIGSLMDQSSINRYEGYKNALEKHQISLEKKYCKVRILTREWGFQAARELLNLPNPPTAILCGNDTAAAGVYRALVSAGKYIPEDCSLIGFGNTEIAEDLDLTSISQHSDKIAQAISDKLVMFMSGQEVPQESVIPANLVIRSSTGKAPGCS